MMRTRNIPQGSLRKVVTMNPIILLIAALVSTRRIATTSQITVTLDTRYLVSAECEKKIAVVPAKMKSARNKMT